MACPSCGCKVHYQFNDADFGPDDERMEPRAEHGADERAPLLARAGSSVPHPRSLKGRGTAVIYRGQLTNWHAALGLSGHDDAPGLPLRIINGRTGIGGTCLRVVDAGGAWVADFRNRTDAKRFVSAYNAAGAKP